MNQETDRKTAFEGRLRSLTQVFQTPYEVLIRFLRSLNQVSSRPIRSLDQVSTKSYSGFVSSSPYSTGIPEVRTLNMNGINLKQHPPGALPGAVVVI